MLCYVIPSSFKSSNNEECSIEENEINVAEHSSSNLNAESVKTDFRYADLFTKATSKKKNLEIYSLFSSSSI